MVEIFDVILHIDAYLASMMSVFGWWVYGVLFLVIFAETGVVVVPFLPGDSLLFAVGALAGGGFINVWVAYVTVTLAAILGDTANYWLGYHVGPRVFYQEHSRVFNKTYLYKTRDFFQKHGGKTIMLARFMPIIRTFAPFVAGVGRMHYREFFVYNVIGAFIWTTSLVFAGYFFGGLALVKENFEYVILAIIVLSFLPMVFEYLKHRRDA